MSSLWYDTVELTGTTIHFSEPHLTMAELWDALERHRDQHEADQTVILRLRERTRKRLGLDKTWAVDTPLGPGVVLAR